MDEGVRKAQFSRRGSLLKIVIHVHERKQISYKPLTCFMRYCKEKKQRLYLNMFQQRLSSVSSYEGLHYVTSHVPSNDKQYGGLGR